MEQLKYGVSIQDNATQQLKDIVNKLEQLKDKKVSVDVEGLKERDVQRFNAMLADSEKMLNRVRDALKNGGEKNILNVAGYDIDKFVEKLSKLDRGALDKDALNNIIGEYNRLVKVYGEIIREQENFVTSKEKANERMIKADIESANSAISNEERRRQQMQAAWEGQEKEREKQLKFLEKQQELDKQAKSKSEQQAKDSAYKLAEQELRTRQKSEEEIIKAANKADEQMIAAKQKAAEERKKIAEKAAEDERKALEKANKGIDAEIERTKQKLKDIDSSLERGRSSGRDMSALADARSRLEGHQLILQHLSTADKKDADLVGKRIKDVRELRDDTERLRKAEDGLTRAREKANKRKDNAAIRQLQEEEKSVRNAWIEYHKLEAQIREIEALRNRGIKANIDVSEADKAIERLSTIQEMMANIINGRGRTNADISFGGSNALAKDVLASEGTKKAMLDSKASLKEYSANLKEAEKRMSTAATTAENLGKYLDKMEAKRVDFQGLDTTKLDESLRKVGEIRAELERFAQTGKSTAGASANEIVRSMGLESAKKEASSALSQLNREVRENERQVKAASDATAQLSESERRLAQEMRNAASETQNQSRVLNDLKSIALQYLSVWGVRSFIGNIIETGGLLEQQRLSLSAILGDMNRAEHLFEQIKSLAIKSPFGVVELDQMSKQLAAYSFQYGELYDWTKRLADISAATGTQVSRLALALGHVRSEGALSGYTLRQFSMANVPLLRMLSENLGISTKEVRAKVKKKEISAKEVQDILKQLTDEGGMFYNAQEVMSEALNAKFKNLRDAFDIMYGEIAESDVGKLLKDIAVALTSGAKQWERFGRDILVVATSFGIMKGAAALTTSVLGRNTAATLTGVRAAMRRENANLRLARATGEITKAEYKELKLRGPYAASALKVALIEKNLTYEELKRAVALRKIRPEIAKAALAQAGYSLKLQESMVALSWWSRATYLAGTAVRALGAALKSMLVSVAPLLALTAVFDLFSRASQQASDAMDSGAEAAKGVSKEYLELSNINKKLGEAEGKNKDELEKGIKSMEGALEKAGLLTPELKEQEGQVKSLTEKYNLLRGALRGAAEDFDDLQARLAMSLGNAMQAGGGSKWKPINWFRDNMNKDLKQYSDAEMKLRNELAAGGKELRENLIKELRKSGKWDEGYAGLSANDLFEKLSDAQKRAWANGPVSSSAGIQAVRKAYESYFKANEEISGKQGKEFAERIGKSAMIMYPDMDFSNLTAEDKINIDKFTRRFLHGLEVSNAAKERARQIVVDNLLGGDVPKYVQEALDETVDSLEEPEGGGDNDDKNAKKLREKVRILKEAGDAYHYWREKVGDGGAASHVTDEYGKLLKELGFSFENVEKFRETLEELRVEYDAKPKTKGMLEALKELDKELADLGRKDFEKNTEEFLSKTKTELDLLTREWDEFNQVLEATGNVDLARGISGASYIEGRIRNTADAVREDLRRDYEAAGGSANALSFNPYLSDRELRNEIEQGAPREDQESLAKFERRISSLVEAYKKWRDLQRDVHKADVQVFTSIVGGAKDYETQIGRIDRKLNDQITSINALYELTSEERDAAIKMATQSTASEKFKLSATYLNLMGNAASMTAAEIQSAADAAKQDLANSLKTNVITAKEFADEMGRIQQIVRDTEFNSILGNGTLNAFANGGIGGVISWLDTAINKRTTELAEKGLYTTDENGAYNGNDEQLLKLLGGAKQFASIQNALSEFLLYLQILAGAFDGLQQAAQSLSDTFYALGNRGAGDFFSDAAAAMGGVGSFFSPIQNAVQNLMSGDIGGIVSSVISAPIQAITGPITAFAKLHDARIEREIERIREDLSSIERNTALIQKSRERTFGYDDGAVRRYYAGQYQNNVQSSLATLKGMNPWDSGFNDAKSMSLAYGTMYDFYASKPGANGYQEEYQNLVAQREEYLDILAKQHEKKNESKADIEETAAKIAELDDQIHNFTLDLAKDLWSIDVKGWADQLSDALASAFDNGENMAEALADTVKGILRTVRNQMLRNTLEPMFEVLNNRLKNLIDPNDIANSAGKVTEEIARFFGKGGEGEQVIIAAREFTSAFETGLRNAGLSTLEENANTLSSGIQGTSEETSDLLAGYVNALRQDVSINRLWLTQFVAELWPSYIEQVSSAVTSIGNIDRNVEAIRMLLSENGALYSLIYDMRSHIDNVVSGNESFAVK